MKMKRHILKITAALGTVLMAGSCLNFDPEAQMSDAQVWDKADNFALFANEFYEWTRDFRGSTSVTYMNGISDGPHSDLRSDLLCEATVNVWSAGTNSIPATDPNYNNLYKRIYYTNLLLEKAAGFADADAISEAVAEAYFFRAYLYFELVQLYGDCILLHEPVDIDSERLYGARDNRLTVINACIQDLKDAAALLGDTPSESGRICRYTAYALLSRIALYEGTWQKYHNNADAAVDALLREAADAAQEVMDSERYSLFYSSELGGRDSYRYMFVLENVQCNPAGLTKSANSEYIFARCHDEVLKPIGLNISHAGNNNTWYPTKKLVDLYRCQDGLPIDKSPLYMDENKGEDANWDFTNRDNRMNAVLMRNGQTCWNNDQPRTSWEAGESGQTASRRVNSGYASYKWVTERSVADGSEGYDYPVIRYAEVLLNYAEAVYELNGTITDDQLDASLNLVRHRSNPDMEPLSNDLVAANGLDMLEEIRAERTVELFLEGFRVDDLKRWKTAESEMPQDLLGIEYSGTWYEANWTSQTRPLENGYILLYNDREWTEKNYLLPLPSDELQLNPELKQNPGWE